MQKLKIGIIFGGPSSEHNVSIKSAISIIQNISLIKYSIIPIYLDITGVWHYINLMDQSNNINISVIKELINDSINEIRYYKNKCNRNIRNIDYNQLHQLLDVVFPIIHGKPGENGVLQGFFELLGIPYIGSSVLSSSITMDKDITKVILKDNGMNVVPYVVVKKYEYINQHKKDSFLEVVSNKFSLPIFIKPATYGSSIGISKIKSYSDIEKGVKNAFKYDNKIIIEQGIDAKEIEVSVLENINNYGEPIVSLPAQIIVNDDFYSYKAKYLIKNGARLQVPAILNNKLIEEIRRKAGEIFTILDCSCLARVDFFLERKSHKIYFNEINTLPGFTEISIYPKLLDLYGIKYDDLLERLISLSLKRYKDEKVKHNAAISLL